MTVSQPNFAHGTNTEQVATDTGGQRPHGSMPPLANKVENIDHGQVSMGCIQVSLPWVDLEIDRVERIDSTRLKIDRLDRSTRLASHCL